MIKIALVVPFINFIPGAKEILARHNQMEGVFDGERYILEEYAVPQEELQDLKFDADVIIARGLYAELLKGRIRGIPLVEVAVQGFDMVQNLLECKRLFPGQKVAVIASLSMVYNVDRVARLLGMEAGGYCLNKEMKADILLRQALRDSCQMVLGGTSACAAAEKLHVDHLLLISGDSSFYQCLTEAKRAAGIHRRAYEKATLYKNIINYTSDGIVAVDSSQHFTMVNPSAQQVLRIKAESTVGEMVSSVAIPQELKIILTDNREYSNRVLETKGKRILLTKKFTLVKGEPVGCVASTANVVPKLVCSIYNQFTQGDIQGALESQYKLNPFRMVFDKATFPVATKDAANLIGLDLGEPVRPNTGCSDEVKALLEKKLDAIGEKYAATV